jgi:protein-tyrosine phosphatase
MSQALPEFADPDALPDGLIDLHSHVLPGIDDGCQSLSESCECVGMLKDAGFVGTLCTPHIWPDMFPANVPENIHNWVHHFQQTLDEAATDYALWPGGELRLFDGVVDWCQIHGVPTLAGTSCVLMDFWAPVWPDWLDSTLDWFFEQGYQPILAHPERTPDQYRLLERLRRLHDRGVRLQGNCLPFTGAEGPEAAHIMRQLLAEQRYDYIALDMHGADSLPDRLTGLDQLRQELGQKELDRLTCEAPRQLLRQARQPNPSMRRR